MRRLNSSYARYYNKKYKRRGFLFQDRYKSIATQEFNYFRELIKYIHLNPLRAGIVRNFTELDKYAWCSHYDIVNGSRFDWYFNHEVMKRFGNTKVDSLKMYYKFLNEGALPFDYPLKFKVDDDDYLGDERVVGDPEFVRNALLLDKNYQIQRKVLKNNGVTINEVKRRVCKYFEIELSQLNRPGRNSLSIKARNIIFYYCYIDLGYSLSSIGDHFKLSSSAVSYGVEKGRKAIEETRINSIF